KTNCLRRFFLEMMGLGISYGAALEQLPPIVMASEAQWWRKLDLNQRRLSQRIYSPSPLTTRAFLRTAPEPCDWRRQISDLGRLAAAVDLWPPYGGTALFCQPGLCAIFKPFPP